MKLLKQQVFDVSEGQREIDVYINNNGRPVIYLFYSPDKASKNILQNGSDTFTSTIETLTHGTYYIRVTLSSDSKWLYFYKEKNDKKVEAKKWKLSDYAK